MDEDKGADVQRKGHDIVERDEKHAGGRHFYRRG